MKKIPKFDCSKIDEKHLQIIGEVLETIKMFNNPMIEEVIKRKFKYVEPSKLIIEHHPFIEECKKIGLFLSTQGHLLENQHTKDEIMIPIVCIQDDVRKFFKLYENIKNKKI